MDVALILVLSPRLVDRMQNVGTLMEDQFVNVFQVIRVTLTPSASEATVWPTLSAKRTRLAKITDVSILAHSHVEQVLTAASRITLPSADVQKALLVIHSLPVAVSDARKFVLPVVQTPIVMLDLMIGRSVNANKITLAIP